MDDLMFNHYAILRRLQYAIDAPQRLCHFEGLTSDQDKGASLWISALSNCRGCNLR